MSKSLESPNQNTSKSAYAELTEKHEKVQLVLRNFDRVMSSSEFVALSNLPTVSLYRTFVSLAEFSEDRRVEASDEIMDILRENKEVKLFIAMHKQRDDLSRKEKEAAEERFKDIRDEKRKRLQS